MKMVKGEEEASTSIKKKLSNYNEAARRRCIYKVHNQYYLQRINEKLNEPTVLAVGPYHRGKEGLKMMEEHKVGYLKWLLVLKEENVDTYISAIAKLEEDARSYYAEDVDHISTPEFIEMLLLDGCFILELLRRFKSRDSICDSDPIFQMDWILQNLIFDLILFENQIPFLVLRKLFDIVEGPNQHAKLTDLICLLFGIEEAYRPNIVNAVNPKEVKHLVHLTHDIFRPSSLVSVELNACPMQREFRLIPSATELKDANVTFRKGEAGSERAVDFTDGVLTMASVTIQDLSESFYRNFIVYEQYFADKKPTYVTDYAILLDCLINTRQDVEILSECGIIENMVGDNQVVADIVNRLTLSVTVSATHFIYGHTFSRINAHHKRPWNRARAALNRDYFNSPWAYISFFAALMLLILTLVQTIFSAPHFS